MSLLLQGILDQRVVLGWLEPVKSRARPGVGLLILYLYDITQMPACTSSLLAKPGQSINTSETNIHLCPFNL